MLLRFAAIITTIELMLTATASVLVTYTDPPPGFATTSDLRELGIPYDEHENLRRLRMDTTWYETHAKLASPRCTLYVSLRTDSSPVDFDFRRSGEEVLRSRPEHAESVVINEPSPGERGYAVRFRGPRSVRFELVRLRGKELLIVRVEREKPFEQAVAAELVRCERRARSVQEHLLAKMRWRD